MIGDLNEINTFIKNSKEKIKVKGTIANYSLKINKRTIKMLNTLPSTPIITLSKKTKEKKRPDFEPMLLLMNLKDKKEIKKMIEDS